MNNHPYPENAFFFQRCVRRRLHVLRAVGHIPIPHSVPVPNELNKPLYTSVLVFVMEIIFKNSKTLMHLLNAYVN